MGIIITFYPDPNPATEAREMSQWIRVVLLFQRNQV